MTYVLNLTCTRCESKYAEHPGEFLSERKAIYCPSCRDIPKESTQQQSIDLGDTLIEWWRGGFGRKDKHFRKHKVIKITPTGRIKTDRGLELNSDLSIRSNHYRGHYISLLTPELKLEMKKQHEKDELHNTLRGLDIHSLLPQEIELLNKTFEPILERLKGESE